MLIELVTNDSSKQYTMEKEIVLSASYPCWACAVMNKS